MFEANLMGNTWVVQHAGVHAKTGHEVTFETEAKATAFTVTMNTAAAYKAKQLAFATEYECGEAFG